MIVTEISRASASRNPLRLVLRVLLFSVLSVMLGGCATYGRRQAMPSVLQGHPQGVLPPDPGYEIIPLRTKDGTRIFGQFGRAEKDRAGLNFDAAHAPTVLFFYGSKQNLTAPHNQRVFRGLRSLGVNVFIPEYPGNGMSDGTASESQCYATADAALDYLLSRSDIDHSRIIAAGQSLGSGPAIDLASRRRLAGVISVGGFTSTADVAMCAVSWMPRWLARSLAADCRFDNLAKIKTVSCPILLVFGTEDTLTPPWMAERLAAAAVVPVTKLPVATAHNSLWKSPYFGLNFAVRDWIRSRSAGD